ncbi:alpha amylase C-terminal domain-containing protein, partial [endosymbiont of Ridgeia piscesae]
YRIGLPQAGSYHEILNSDSKFYAGSNLGNDGQIQAEQLPWMNQPHSAVLRLPPLGAIVLKPEG